MTNGFERDSGTASIDQWQDYHTRMAQYERGMVQYRKDIARYNRRKKSKIASIILPVLVVCASTLVLARNNHETAVAAPEPAPKESEVVVDTTSPDSSRPGKTMVTRESSMESTVDDSFEQLSLFWDEYFIENTGEPFEDPNLVFETQPGDLCFNAVDTARYCVGSRTIIMPAGDLIDLSNNYGVSSSSITSTADYITALAVSAHEYGHGIHLAGLEGHIGTITPAQGEAFADCVAGASIASIHGMETAYQAAQFMQTVGDDYADSPHDTPTARQMFVEAGALGGVEGCIELVGA